MEEPNEGEAKDDNEKRPPTDSAECGDDAAIAGSVAMQVVVVYVPLLQNAFGTTSLNVSDWILCIAVASSVLWLREGSKAVIRRKGSHV
jgi:Cation transporting ATPase, C-terminus